MLFLGQKIFLKYTERSKTYFLVRTMEVMHTVALLLCLLAE